VREQKKRYLADRDSVLVALSIGELVVWISLLLLSVLVENLFPLLLPCAGGWGLLVIISHLALLFWVLQTKCTSARTARSGLLFRVLHTSNVLTVRSAVTDAVTVS
jgi:hypothetical protein